MRIGQRVLARIAATAGLLSLVAGPILGAEKLRPHVPNGVLSQTDPYLVGRFETEPGTELAVSFDGMAVNRFELGRRSALAPAEEQSSRYFIRRETSLTDSLSPPTPNPIFFASYSGGFYNDDARSVVADPGGLALAVADGYELGFRQVLNERLELAVAFWWLDLAEEIAWMQDQSPSGLDGPTGWRGPEVEATWRLSERVRIDATTFSSQGFMFRVGVEFRF